MKVLNKVYQQINILSLDVVLGAVIGALFLGSIMGADIPWVVLAALSLTVWIIYTLDHLRDAMTIPTIASTDRHRFHQKHFRTMTLVLSLVTLLNLVLIYFLPSDILRCGSMLGLVVVIYLTFQRYLKFLKEFFVACLYTLGILLPSFVDVQNSFQPIHYLIIGKYFITALMNLLLFSLFDFKDDRHHQQHSFVTWFGPRSTRHGIVFLGVMNIASGIWLWQYDMLVAIIFICMNLVLLAVLFMKTLFLSDNYYRIAGDAIFFIPALYFLWPR